MRVCGAGAGPLWSRGGVGVPDSTLQCLWGGHRGDGPTLFLALPDQGKRDRNNF